MIVYYVYGSALPIRRKVQQMIEFKSALCAALEKAIAALLPEGAPTAEEIGEMLTTPPDPAMGDYAFPCFKLAKPMRKAPPVIAGMLKDALPPLPDLEKAEVAGGYLNFSVSDSYYTVSVLNEIEAKGGDYGRPDFGAGKTVVLDYSSPNVAKPFHIGHLGTTVIGHSLKKLHEFAGYHCIGINHLGDWGTQFGKLIVAYRTWGSKEQVEKGGVDELVSLYVRFHEEAEKDPALNDAARAEFSKLEHHDEENIALWKWFIDLSLREYEKTYRQLGITFDYYTGESFYTDLMPAQVEKLREKNLLTIDDGASIVDLSAYKMPPCLILKRDGSTLYPTRDIAAAVYRHDTFAFDKAIYVTSAQQIMHFQQWFRVLDLMGYDWYDRCVHVPYGTVSVNGEKLSTRTGNVVLLRDLFKTAIEKVSEIMAQKNPDLPDRESVAEAVGVGAIVFHYLSNSRIKDINFMMDDALNFDGNTGPYVQYTYARTCSVLEKAGGIPEAKGDYQANAAEVSLLKTLSKFESKVTDAIDAYEPMVITRYLLDVAGAFNQFYHECQILTADTEAAKAFRLRLTAAAKTVLGSALELICMKKTEKI